MQNFEHEDYKKEKLQLILQALQQLGFDRTVESLSADANIQHETVQVQKLRTFIFEGRWDETLEFINKLNFEDQVQHQIQLILMEQKYLHLLQQNDTIKAVEVLRKLIQPICLDKDKMHNLATHLMITMQPEEEELSSEKIILKSSLDVFSEVFALCHKQIDHFEPKRLESLFTQAKAKQIMQNEWHPGLEDDFTMQESVHGASKKLTQDMKSLEFKCHQDEVLFCQFSANGKYLASACKSSRLCVWELQIPQQPNSNSNHGQPKRLSWIQILNQNGVHSQPIHLITFSPCSQLIATCSYDQTAKVFVLFPEVKLLYSLKGHQNKVCGLGWKFSTPADLVKKSKSYFTFTQKKLQQSDFVDFWEIYTGSLDGWVSIWKCGQKKGGFKTDPITQLVVFGDKIFMEHAPNRKISIYDAFRKIELRQILEKDEIVSSCMNKDYSLILINVSFTQPRLNLYSVENLQLLKSFTGFVQTKFCLRACFGWFNHNLIAIGSEDGQLMMWHVKHERKPVLNWKITNKTINTVDFNQEYPQIFALASDDKVLRLFYPNDMIMDVGEVEFKGPKNIKEHLSNFLSWGQEMIHQQGHRVVEQQATMVAEEDQSMEYESQEDEEEDETQL